MHRSARPAFLIPLGVSLPTQKCVQRLQRRASLGFAVAARLPSTPPAARGGLQHARDGRRAPIAAASARLRCSTASAKRRSSHEHASERLQAVTLTVPHQRGSSASGKDTAPDQQKSASRRHLNAWPPARCARGKQSRHAHAHEQRRGHALLCRRVRASACRRARAAAHASPTAQGRPSSSMISPEAINGEAATAEPALAVFGTAARGAATHVMLRRCGEWGTRIPASWHRAHPRTANSRCFTRFVLWARRGAH